MHALSILRVNCVLLSLLALPGCLMPATPAHMEVPGAEAAVSPVNVPAHAPANAVAKVLDDWHQAAAGADAETYLGLMAPEFRFLGTDATERWDRISFTTYVDYYFRQEHRGWTYLPQDRVVNLAPDGQLAWFDEILKNQGYGELRGSGVLLLEPEGWRIAQYSMTFTVPNSAAKAVVSSIREEQAKEQEEQTIPADESGSSGSE